MVTSPVITVRSGDVSGCPARAAPPEPGGTTILCWRVNTGCRLNDVLAGVSRAARSGYEKKNKVD